MQQWNWIKLNPNGTIDVDVSHDPEVPHWLHIGRAKVKDLRKYGTAIEDADDAVGERENQIRHDAGYTDEVRDLMMKMSDPVTGFGGDMDQATAAEMLGAADAAGIQRKYVSLLQRYLMSDENPYTEVWIELLNDADLVNPTLGTHDTGELPVWAFGQEVLQAVIAHWQQVPLTLGLEAAPTTQPNRAQRRASAKTL